MSDDLVCSDFCEERGFARPADLLRALGGGQQTVYVVMERGAEYNDNIMAPNAAGDPKWVFLDRAEAENAAAERGARWHREHNILDYCYELKDVTSYPAGELARRISEILGRPYDLPGEGEPTYAGSEGPLVEGPVTDEQMRRIAELFTLKFFYVVETHFSEPEPALLFGDGSSPGEGHA
jgi:hypothetical protein